VPLGRPKVIFKKNYILFLNFKFLSFGPNFFFFFFFNIDLIYMALWLYNFFFKAFYKKKKKKN
jgi:hypothetical protein